MLDLSNIKLSTRTKNVFSYKNNTSQYFANSGSFRIAEVIQYPEAF